MYQFSGYAWMRRKGLSTMRLSIKRRQGAAPVNSRTSIVGPYLAFANALADTARQVLAEHGQDDLGTSIKADNTLVTRLDVCIEQRLRDQIAAAFPAHGIIGEEAENVRPGSSHVWVLDPIDGTASFVAGIPVFGTLITLAVDGVPVLGVIDAPTLNLRWLGAAGGATQCNGRDVATRPGDKLSQALLLAGNRDRFAPEQTLALDALRVATGTRVYGGACLSYGRLAEGRANLALDAGQSVYDFAPYRPIIEGAGGVISDWNGKPLTLESDGNILAAGDARIHRQALDVLGAAARGEGVLP